MPDGILIIDKPAGWTSMDVCAKLRGILREKRIGHAGTLDPMATGVLPVFVGRATKAVQFAENGRKEYHAVLKLGTVTDTQDTTGTVLETHPVTVGADEVRAALEHFTGELLQLPPMYSALKVNGQKLYDLARQGKTVERKPRAITVYELELLEQSAPDEFTLRVVCSKGTYIRTLCHDLGQALGCGGCMAALRRTMAAGFRIEEAVTLERAQEEREALLLPLDEYFRAYPRFTVQNETQEKRAYNDDLVRPKFAIMDPELTMTLPDYQTEAGCADIMMHTMERYFVNSGTMELTDALAEGLLRTVMHNAEVLHTDPRNYDARAEVMWASSLAHNGLTGCGSDGGDWMPHLLEHEMGGMFNVTHGAGLAAVWPSWARYVYKDCLPRFVKYAVNVMGVTPGATDEETALAGIAAMEEFYHRIGMPVNFKELGIDPTDEQMAEMAASCARACGGAKGSAKVLHQSDMEAIYKMLK